VKGEKGERVKGAGSRAVGPYLLYKLGEMLANIGNMFKLGVMLANIGNMFKLGEMLANIGNML